MKTLEERKARWKQFYDHNSDVRTMIVVTCIHPDRPLPYPENKEARIEWGIRNYEYKAKMSLAVDDDSLPFLYPYTGTEIFAAAFGSKVHYPKNDMPFALPCIYEASEVARLKQPDLNAPSIQEVFEIADRLYSYGGPGSLLEWPDVQSPFDIAALIWHKESLLYATIEEPEAVKELTGRAQKLLFEFLDEWRARYGTEFIAHYPDYYMPDGVTLSEDELSTISPAAFREFCLPSLLEIAGRYGAMGIHCCADSEHQWDNLCKIPDLRMLNLVLPLKETLKSFHHFRGKAALMNFVRNDSYHPYLDQIPPETHIVLHADASGLEDALGKLEALNKIAEKRDEQYREIFG